MDDEEGAGLHQEAWVSRLAGCRWFGRGWTLQELIAPKQLVFFGADWNFIGSKLDLLYTLSDITGIDPNCAQSSLQVGGAKYSKKIVMGCTSYDHSYRRHGIQSLRNAKYQYVLTVW